MFSRALSASLLLVALFAGSAVSQTTGEELLKMCEDRDDVRCQAYLDGAIEMIQYWQDPSEALPSERQLCFPESFSMHDLKGAILNEIESSSIKYHSAPAGIYIVLSLEKYYLCR